MSRQLTEAEIIADYLAEGEYNEKAGMAQELQRTQRQRFREGSSFVYNNDNTPDMNTFVYLAADVYYRHRINADEDYERTDKNREEAMRNEYGGFIPYFDSMTPDMAYRQHQAREGRMKRITLPNGQLTGLDADISRFVTATFRAEHHPSCAPKTVSAFKTLVDISVRTFKFSRASATRLVAVYPIKAGNNELLANFISAHTRLRCFDILPFIQNDKLRYYGDLFIRLLWPRQNLASDTYLGILCRQYLDSSREELVLFFAQLVSVVATTFIMLPNVDEENNRRITMDDVDEALRLFPSRFWNTNDMPSQVSGSQYDLVDGFNLCSETLKIGMDEIRRTVCQERTINLGRSIVMEHLDIITITTFSEMFAYLYCRIFEKPSVEDFVASVTHHAHLFYDKFRALTARDWRDDYLRFKLTELRKKLLGCRTVNRQWVLNYDFRQIHHKHSSE